MTWTMLGLILCGLLWLPATIMTWWAWAGVPYLGMRVRPRMEVMWARLFVWVATTGVGCMLWQALP